MTIVQIDELYFKLDKENHTVAYAERAAAAVNTVSIAKAGNIKAVACEGAAKAVLLLEEEIKEFLISRGLNPSDFSFRYRYESSNEGKFYWPPSNSGELRYLK